MTPRSLFRRVHFAHGWVTKERRPLNSRYSNENARRYADPFGESFLTV